MRFRPSHLGLWPVFAAALLLVADARGASVTQPLNFNGTGSTFSGEFNGAAALNVQNLSGAFSLDATVNVAGTPVGVGLPTASLAAPNQTTIGVAGGSFSTTISGSGAVTYQDQWVNQYGQGGPDGKADDALSPNGMMSATLQNMALSLPNNVVLTPTGAAPTFLATLDYNIVDFNILGAPFKLDYIVPLLVTATPNLTLQSTTFSQTAAGLFTSPTAPPPSPGANVGDGAHPLGPSILDLSSQYSGAAQAAIIGNTNATIGGSVNVGVNILLSQAFFTGTLAGLDFALPGGVFGDTSVNFGNQNIGALSMNQPNSGFIGSGDTVKFLEIPTLVPNADNLRVQLQGTSTAGNPAFVAAQSQTITGNYDFTGANVLAFSNPYSIDLGIATISGTISGEFNGVLQYQLTSVLGFSNVTYDIKAQDLSGVVNTQATPALTATSTSFGSTLVGMTSTATVTATNTGGNPSTLTGTIGPSSNAEITPTSGTQAFSLNFGASSTRTFTYAPLARGFDSTVIAVTSDGGNANRTISGTGRAPVSNPVSAISFGNVLVGMSVNGSTNVQNTGDGNLSGVAGDGVVGAPGGGSNLNLNRASVSGPFGIVGATHLSIPDASTQSATYSYSPTVRGANSQTGTINFLNGNPASGGNNTAHNRTFNMTGTGVAPVNQTTTTGASFGNVRIGTTATQGVLTVQNIGNGNLSGVAGTGVPGAPGGGSNLNGSVTPSAGPFSLVGGSGISLGDGASASFSYGYTPTGHMTDTANVVAGFLNGNSNQANTPQNIAVNVSGTGVGPEFTGVNHTVGSTIDFGTVAAGVSTTMALILTNSTGDVGLPDALVGLTLLGYTITPGPGTGPTDFQLVGFMPGTVLSPADVLGLLVQFNSMLPDGPRIATLTFLTDQNAAFGAAGDTFSFTLIANVDDGVVPEPSSLVIWGAIFSLLGGTAWWRRRRR